MPKKAKDLLQDACTQLQTIKGTLNQAMQSAEKPENKKTITDTMNAVDNALNTANGSLSSYKD